MNALLADVKSNQDGRGTHAVTNSLPSTSWPLCPFQAYATLYPCPLHEQQAMQQRL